MKKYPARLNRKSKAAAIRPRSTAHMGNATIVGPQTFGVVIFVRNDSASMRTFRYMCAKFGVLSARSNESGEMLPVDSQRNAFEIFALPGVLEGMIRGKFCVSVEQRINAATPRGAAGASSEEQTANARKKPAIIKRAIVRANFRDEFSEGTKRVEKFATVVKSGVCPFGAVKAIRG